MIQYNISFAGAGRVAGELCRALYSAGHKITLIVSESEINGRSLADSVNARWSRDLIYSGTDHLIIVAVPDHRLKEVLGKIRCSSGNLVVHTAGSFGLDVFPDGLMKKGVFYPLQTFTKGRKIDFNNLPFFLESNDKSSYEMLLNTAESIGAKVYAADTSQRRMIHLAAVFANNFTNHMLASAKLIVSEAGYSFDILRPLIEETFSKALATGSENSQTGPAVRNDFNTIEKHLELLSFSPDLKNLYSEVTQAIINYHKKF
jgi:predicted short-subunit dehydrogenase-like oxidoreductase (DUF2520 family)